MKRSEMEKRKLDEFFKKNMILVDDVKINEILHEKDIITNVGLGRCIVLRKEYLRELGKENLYLFLLYSENNKSEPYLVCYDIVGKPDACEFSNLYYFNNEKNALDFFNETISKHRRYAEEERRNSQTMKEDAEEE